MKKIQETMMRDMGWKLLSVVIAVTLWFMVINLEHPVDTRTYIQTIHFENEEQLAAQGLTVRGQDDLENMKISIKVKAQRTALDRLSQYKGNIKASVDLQKAVGFANGETLSLPVDVRLPEIVGASFEILNKSPQTVEVTIEDLISKRQQVEAVLGGSVSSGYLFQSATVTPEYVTISGASSAVAQVAQVRADVNMDGLSASTDIKVVPVACDANGNTVKGVTISVPEVNVHVSVNQSKKVELLAETTGVPASGYTVGDITITPSTIEVQGPNERLANLTEIQLPDIDVYDAARSITRSFTAEQILPVGVSLKEGGTANIQVRVEIKQEGRGKITIPTANIAGGASLVSGLSYTFDADTLVIDVQGIGQTGNIQADNVTASADFTAISEPGNYTLKVNVILPPGLTLAGAQPTIGVTVTQDTPVEQPTEPPEEPTPPTPEPTPETPNGENNVDDEIPVDNPAATNETET